MKTKVKMVKKILSRIALGFTAFAIVIASFTIDVSAAQITNRSVAIGNSVASAATSYTFTFSVPSSTAIRSVAFQACTTASGTCVTPSGFSIAGSSLAGQPSGLGATTSWSNNTSTAGSLRITHASNTTAPSANSTVIFNNVTNPSATNATYFFRITTYSDAAWTTAIDTGNVATSTAGVVTVTASVDETLVFTLGTTTAALGTLTTSTTGSATSSMTASTNASSGYSISVNGSTLSSGGNTITPLSSANSSSVNNKQFGMNLMANTTPSVGTATSGTGNGTPSAGYNSSNSFKFATGDTVASASAPTNSNTYTVSYIANIDGSTAAGSYSTLLTYIATVNY
jgi:hypothetical protein